MSSISASDASGDFEAKNWKQARANFKEKHEDSDKLRTFLGNRTDGDNVKGECLRLKSESENKYQQALGGILENIDALMNLGDIAIKSAPESVGLAWMGVRMCLRAVQGDWATFQLFSGACADIIGIMISCRVYGKMYSSQSSPKDFLELHDQVIDFIPNIYTNILEFSYAVYEYTRRSPIIRIGKNIIKDVKGGFEGRIKDIKLSDEKMRNFARTASERMIIHLQSESMKNQDVMRLEVVSLRDTLNASLKANEAIVRRLFDELEEEKRNTKQKTPYEKAQDEYEENLGHLDPSEVQYELLQENLDIHREPHTCRWIFDLKEYTDWYESPGSSMIWVSGEGGYGKSILMSTVVERLRARHTDSSKAVVQYFFCKAGTVVTQNTAQILKSIVAHLYANSLAFPDVLEQANKAINIGLGKKNKTSTVKFNFEIAYGGLLQAVGGDVFLVIDALDECIDRQDEHLVRKLRTIVETANTKIKIMVCSRPKADIAIDLHGIPQIKCEGNNKADIERNVTTEMRQFPGWSISEKRYAVEQIVEKSGGQFKFVQIALEFLRKPLVRPFEPTIDGLPNGLDGSYITSWNATNKDYLELLKTALTWTLFSDGSITVPEIMDAYSRTYSAEAGIRDEENEENESHDREGDEKKDDDDNKSPSEAGKMDLHEKQIRIAGGQFLEVSESGQVTLRHLTVRDFFIPKEDSGRVVSNQRKVVSSPPWSVSAKQGHLEILKVLLQNLISPVFQKTHLIPFDQTSEFSSVDYYGGDHNNQGGSDSSGYSDEDDDDEHEEDDTDEGEEQNEEANEEQDEDENSDEDEDEEQIESRKDKKDDERVQEVVSGVSELPDFYGQQPIRVEEEISDKSDKTSNSSVKSDAHAQEPEHLPGSDTADIVEFNEEEVIEYGSEFTGNGSEANSDEDSNTKARAVKKQGRYEMTHWDYHLHEAQKLWSVDEQQSNVDWKRIWANLLKFMCEDTPAFQTWLRFICYHRDSISYLQICRGSPLHVAAFLGLSSLVRILIDKGYDVNQTCRDLRFDERNVLLNPLTFAVWSEKIDVATVRLLVDHGADLNFSNQTGLEYTDSTGDDYWITPFQAAVLKNPTKDFIQYLLAHGAKPSFADERGQTALHHFSRTGTDPDALLVLIKACTNIDLINVSSKSGQTPLHVLVERKNDLPINLLRAYLKAKANVNSEDKESMRPLHNLALNGNTEAVEMLIEYDADIHDVDSKYQTAFHAAAQSGNVETLKVLLKHGAKPNLVDKEGRTPLYLACRANNEETAVYLIQVLKDQTGIEVNKTANNGSTPLREAASRGNVNLINLILSTTDPTTAINASDAKFRQNSLHKAAVNGRKAALDFLIEQGGDLSLKDKNSLTPFQLCVKFWIKKSFESRAMEETLSLFIEKKVPSPSELDELMFTSASKGSVRVVESLINAGVNPRAEDTHGWTPLLLAEHYKQQGVIDVISRQRRVRGKKPSGWVLSGQRIKISDDALEVRAVGPKFLGVTVVSDHPVPASAAKYYFEIEIALDDAATKPFVSHWEFDEEIVIGATTLPAILEAACLGRLRTKEWKEYGFKKSYAWNVVQNIYHRFDGIQFNSEPNWTPCKVGDIVGCGIDNVLKTVFFTKNGERFEFEFEDVVGRLYPAVSIQGRYIAKANFGGDVAGKPFKWEGWKEWSKGL